jgi:energy-coupling factor transport system permease protein
MSVFFYTRRQTPLHALDPRAKVAGLVALFAAASITTAPAPLAVLLAIIIGLFGLSRSFSTIGRTIALLGVIAVTTFGLWFLLYHRHPGFAVLFAATSTLRFVDFLLAGLLFLSITPLEEFSAGLILLRVPYPVAFAVSLSFRLVMLFIDTGFTIVEAQRVRGNTVEKGSIIARIRAYTPLLVPLILNGVKKAETLNLALESKGFSPRNRIDLRDRYPWQGTDWIAAALSAVIVGASIWWRVAFAR